MKKSKTILPCLGLGTVMAACGSIVSCNSNAIYTITFDGGVHGYVSSTQKANNGTKWSDIVKPIINADWGYVLNGWKDDGGNPLIDSTIINSSIKALAQYRDIQADEQFNKTAGTLVPYATQMNFYTPVEYYQDSTCLLIEHEAYNEYTFTIDASINTKGIRYFWVSKSLTTFAIFDQDIFIKSLKHDGQDINFSYSSSGGYRKAYITFNEAYKSGIITLQLKFGTKIKGIPCFEINEY